MVGLWPKQTTLLFVGIAVLSLLTACAGRRVSTSVSDQAFLPGPPPQAVSAPVEAPAAPMQPAPTPQPAPRPAVEAPAPATRAEEARVTESPIAPAPLTPPQPAKAPSPETPPSASHAPLSDVYFDFDQFLIRKDAVAVLDANARLLKTDTGRTILLEGHCDERGTLAYNLILGERRARAVKQYLQDLGVPHTQIQITSYGKERPFCTEHSEACWQSNRRAHFQQR